MGIIALSIVVPIVIFTACYNAGLHHGCKKLTRQGSEIDFQNYMNGVHSEIFDITPKQNPKEEV